MAHEAARGPISCCSFSIRISTTFEYSALVELAATHKPIVLVLNKADLYTPQELTELLSVLSARG